MQPLGTIESPLVSHVIIFSIDTHDTHQGGSRWLVQWTLKSCAWIGIKKHFGNLDMGVDA